LNTTHPNRRRALAVTLLGSALIAFAGCGDDDSGDESAQDSTTAAETAVDAGDIEKAKSVYTSARAPFERIEPVAGAFGDLDPDIDGREGDIPADDWGGYHRIEKALWIDESTKGLEPITKELVSDVANLEDIAKKADFDPAEMAQGAVDLLGEVSASKITGEEERYSRTDLWDFEANVDGSLAAFEALEPAITEADPDLAKELAKQFDETYAALDEYRRDDGFVYYYELSTDDTAKLSQRIDALAEPLSQVAAIVG
jgi:iron uptake system component EfeO